MHRALAAVVLMTVTAWLPALDDAAEPRSDPNKRPAVVSLNPRGPIAPSVTPAAPAGQPLRVSPGKIQVLKVDGFDGEVTWNIIQPVNPGGSRVNVVEYATMPKGTPIFGFLEGDTKAKKHTFDSEVLCVMATGEGSGFVVAQALIVEKGKITPLAEMILEVAGGVVPPPPPVDPLLTAIQTAYTADASSLKDEDRKALAAVYRGIAIDVAKKDSVIMTIEDLFTVIKGASDSRIAERLKPIRQLVGAELDAVLPNTKTTVLTAAHREAAAVQLNRAAAALEKLK